VVSERVQRLGRGSFYYEDLGEHALKGIGDSVRVWAVISSETPASS